MKEYSACTTILVGKNASIDGTTMIARNDDTFRPITPQKFIIEPARHGEKKHINKNVAGVAQPHIESLTA